MVRTAFGTRTPGVRPDYEWVHPGSPVDHQRNGLVFSDDFKTILLMVEGMVDSWTFLEIGMDIQLQLELLKNLESKSRGVLQASVGQSIFESWTSEARLSIETVELRPQLLKHACVSWVATKVT